MRTRLNIPVAAVIVVLCVLLVTFVLTRSTTSQEIPTPVTIVAEPATKVKPTPAPTPEQIRPAPEGKPLPKTALPPMPTTMPNDLAPRR